MPRMMSMWLAAGGAALAGATFTYLATRAQTSPFGGPLVNKARENWGRARSFVAKTAGPDFSGSGHSAFDEYRTDTLKVLDDDEREFQEYLERLRHAKDRAEFDQFMADRKNGDVKRT